MFVYRGTWNYQDNQKQNMFCLEAVAVVWGLFNLGWIEQNCSITVLKAALVILETVSNIENENEETVRKCVHSQVSLSGDETCYVFPHPLR